MAKDDFKPGFFKTLLVLQDYLPEIVIGGGWVPLIYYHYLLGDKSIYPMFTKDIDLIVPDRVPIIGAKSIERLLLNAGLKVEFKSRHNPPAICYEGQIDGDEVEIQFLTHRKGNAQNAVLKVQDDLNAQALRYISILLENPIEVEIDDLPLTTGHPLSVRVPLPGAYIFHKALIFPRRDEKLKKAKDLYYIFDILANFPQLHKRITADISMLKAKYPDNWFREFKRNLETSFAGIGSDGVDFLVGQRPADAFSSLDDNQFRHYIIGVFEDFFKLIF